MTISHIQQLKKDGKIVAYTLPKESNKPGGRKVAKHFTKRSKEKDWIGWNLLCWTMEKCVGYNGVFSEKSRHLTAVGHTGDLNKLNSAQAQGWKVIQLSPLNYKQLLTELNKNV